MTNDLINMQIAIDALIEWYGCEPDDLYAFKEILEKRACIECVDLDAEVSKTTGWIPVTERLPEEHDSMFAKYYGTDRWDEYMYRKVSDDVLVTVMRPTNGTKCVITSHTADGQWRCGALFSVYGAKITAWMPLPEPYDGEGEEK